jgi:hypothetical protein
VSSTNFSTARGAAASKIRRDEDDAFEDGEADPRVVVAGSVSSADRDMFGGSEDVLDTALVGVVAGDRRPRGLGRGGSTSARGLATGFLADAHGFSLGGEAGRRLGDDSDSGLRVSFPAAVGYLFLRLPSMETCSMANELVGKGKAY